MRGWRSPSPKPSCSSASTSASSPSGPQHAAGLAVAAADGEVSRKWTTTIPSPDEVPAEIERRLAASAGGPHRALGDLPPRRHPRRHDHLLAPRRGQPPPRDRRHLARRLRPGHPGEPGGEAPAALPGVRRPRLHRRRVPHPLAQPAVAAGDRGARREAGRRAAQPPGLRATARSATPSCSRSCATSGRPCGPACWPGSAAPDALARLPGGPCSGPEGHHDGHRRSADPPRGRSRAHLLRRRRDRRSPRSGARTRGTSTRGPRPRRCGSTC